MKTENGKTTISYKEFCAFMERYNKENKKRETKKEHVNPFKYKKIFKTKHEGK